MSKNLGLSIKQKKTATGVTWEGTVSIQGMKPTKLVRSTGQSEFSSRATLMTSARSLAKRLGFGLVETNSKVKAKKTSKPAVQATAVSQ